MIFLSNPAKSWGQDIVKLSHIVQRGETIENLVETDAPYLTPKPYRGHQNETGYVRYVAEAIAKLKDIPLEKVGDATYKNTVRVYGLK